MWKLYGQTYEEANVISTEGKRWITAWAEQQLPQEVRAPHLRKIYAPQWEDRNDNDKNKFWQHTVTARPAQLHQRDTTSLAATNDKQKS